MTFYSFKNRFSGATKVVKAFAFHEALRKAHYSKGWDFIHKGPEPYDFFKD